MAENEKKIDTKIEFIPLSELLQKPKPEKDFIMAKELLDKTVIIYRISFYQGTYGDYAVVQTDFGFFRTSSRILIKQLKDIDKIMEEKKLKGVRATLRKRKSSTGREYYIFE